MASVTSGGPEKSARCYFQPHVAQRGKSKAKHSIFGALDGKERKGNGRDGKKETKGPGWVTEGVAEKGATELNCKAQLGTKRLL